MAKAVLIEIEEGPLLDAMQKKVEEDWAKGIKTSWADMVREAVFAYWLPRDASERKEASYAQETPPQ